MLEIKGKYNNAIVYTKNIENEAIDQIKLLCDQEFTKDARIRIMPDCHKGAGCTIGFTMNITDKLVPNLVGVDIGCGMLCVSLGKTILDLKELDEIIKKYIPSGMNVHNQRKIKFELDDLKCFKQLKDPRRLEKSIGSLGGGNHFIEIDQDDEHNKYLIIHTGSRNLGHQVAKYYQNLAIDLCSGKDKMFVERDQIIEELKAQGRKKEIQSQLKQLEVKYQNLFPDMPDELCYLSNQYLEDYLHDMKICQEFASINRYTINNIILEKLQISAIDTFETVHNYIDFDDMILRKGAVKAIKKQPILIPINMKDGCILAVGKSNPQWNNSAPHGAGRILSRTKAFATLSLDEFKETMKDVYSTTIDLSTLDEAPMAYKPMQEIIDNITDTADIIKIIKPIYNFKASDELNKKSR